MSTYSACVGAETASFQLFAHQANPVHGQCHLMRQALIFFIAVIGMTFASTFVHEMSHAAAWGDAPAITFHSDRAAAEEALIQHETRIIDGRVYRVETVDQTTVALYPTAILASGAGLGMLPASLLPSPVLGSTFYALDDQHYEHMAAGGSATHWHHAAMPLIVNMLLAIPIVAWFILRPGALSSAAIWVNAAEWRFNVHHASEIGIPAGVYLAISLAIMTVVAIAIGLRAGQRVRKPSIHDANDSALRA